MIDQLTTIEKIRMALDELQEIHGIEYLTYEICGNSRKSFVRCKVNLLALNGEATVIPGGGRGHKTIIRKNRNSPGYPSRRDKHQRQVP